MAQFEAVNITVESTQKQYIATKRFEPRIIRIQPTSVQMSDSVLNSSSVKGFSKHGDRGIKINSSSSEPEIWDFQTTEIRQACLDAIIVVMK